MKNLNKVLAMLVVFVMMLSTVAFASSFTDVADTSSFSTAIEVGVDLGIIKGYTDGTFAPEGEITRAEFAAIVVRLLGQEAQAEGAKATTQFVDVPASHWAAGYINIATQAKVINGYGDGNFGPEDLVEYQDAITMIVRALGYEPAIGSAGYPTGYLTKAGELGLTSNVNGVNGVAINRGTVAQIAFNALDVPLMTQSGYGTFTQYVINDGYSATTGQVNVKKTLLSENYDIVKIHGVIESSTDATSTSATGTDKVTVDVTNGMYNKFNIDGTRTMEVGTSDAMKFVGKKCVIFVEYDEFKTPNCTIKSLYEIANDDILVVNMADIESLVLNYDKDADGIKDNADGDKTGSIKYTLEGSKTSKVSTFALNSEIYYNGINLKEVKINLHTGADSDSNGIIDTVDAMLAKSGTIEFANLNNSTADFDTVYITVYDVAVVKEVRESAERVVNKAASGGLNRINYNEEDGDVKATLVDAKGAAMDWAALEENDVLAIKYVLTTAGRSIYEAAVVENTITGTVTEIDDSTSDKYVVIDGTEYKVLSIAENDKKIKVGDEGTYYLTESGIVWHEASISINGNYGYIIARQNANTSTMTDAKIKMLTKDNGIVTFNVASKIYVTDVRNDGTAQNPEYVWEKSATKIDSTGLTSQVAAGELVTYKLDSSNTIVAIEKAVDLTNATYGAIFDADREDYFTKENSVAANWTNYDPDDKSFNNKYTLTENTVVFDASALKLSDPTDPTSQKVADPDNYEVVAIANLAEGDKLGGVYAYNVDEDDNVGAIVITNAANTLISGATNAATFVTATADATNEDGDPIVLVKGYVNGEAVTYEFDGAASAVTVGKLFVPEYKANGEVKAFIPVVDGWKNNATPGASNYAKGFGGKAISQDSTKGRVTVYSADAGANVLLKVPATANVYVWDADSNNRVKYEVDSYIGYVEYDKDLNNWYIDKNTTYSNATNTEITIYAYEFDGEIVDVVYYLDK